ncbi:MAG: hypothetical protein GHCLOJNM_01216 [bacterium]|nr:hypothetical protein [bacterium]
MVGAEVGREEGTALVIRSEVSGAGDARPARLVAVHVPQGEPPTPFLPPGPFTATWKGFIEVDLRDRFQFAFEGTGKMTLTVEGKTALEADSQVPESLVGKRVRLNKGANRFEATYYGPGDGDATARLLWASTEFPLEPIPATVLTHSPTEGALLDFETRHRGRNLFVEYRCIRCHRPSEERPLHEDWMGPSLAGIGGRLHPSWITSWIENPRAMRPDSSMPRVLPKENPAQTARDIAAYLATLADATQAAVIEAAEGQATLGAERFESLGCIACHTLAGESDSVEPPRISLGPVAAKWKPGALRDFLLKPNRHYPMIRMPDFRLSEGEANALAAFVLSQAPPRLAPDSEPVGDPEQGREALATLGCLACHDAPIENRATAPSLEAVFGSSSERGCLLDGASVDFSFSAEERADLQDFLASGPEALFRSDPVESAAHRLDHLRCNACHAIDGRGDVWPALRPPPERAEDSEAELELPEEGDAGQIVAIDQSRPSLTFAGEKLRPSALRAILRGECDPPPRPWLAARMPSFTEYAELLADGLARMHGFGPEDPPRETPDPELAEIGRKLVSQSEGFGCTSCHGVGDRPPQAVFETMGVNLMLSAERSRKDFLARWLLNPLRIDPRSKMPRYSIDNKKTPLVTLLDGDAPRQFEAICQYLLAGRDILPPEETAAIPPDTPKH